MSVYATIHLLHSSDLEFEPGDVLDHHYTPEQLEVLITRKHASTTRPKGVPAACALTTLSWRPHPIRAGQRIDGLMRQALVRDIVARGDATYESPGAA